MSAMSLLLASLVLSAAGGTLALLTRRTGTVSKSISCIVGATAALLSSAAGIIAMVVPSQSISFAGAFPFAAFSILLDPLSGLLVTVISILAFAAWVYGISYFDDYLQFGIGSIGFFMNMFIASMLLVVIVDNAFWFLVFFEMMSLTSFFLVIVEQDEASIRGGFLYLVMAHIGFIMIMISFFIMASMAGSFDFSAFRDLHLSAPVASLCFILAFLGFGFKAGMMPFHSWLPLAHPAAPSNVSALMSGGMIKIGIFGIVKVAFDLLGASGGQVWWGIVVIAFGAVSSVLGVVYALAEHDVKRLLAYHSVENIGIILIGVGVALVGWALGLPVVAGIGLMAALYHLLNHAMFKGLLFLGAGSLLHSVHSRNMEIMGGLSKVMPVTALCFLIGALAISAIPPLNGFVSEWFTYQALFDAAMGGGVLIKVVAGAAAVALAITGALAVTCFVKAYGVTFSGVPHSEAARNAKEVPGPMRFSMILLAVLCIFLGVGAPVVAPVMQGVASSLLSGSTVAVTSGTALVNVGGTSMVDTSLMALILLATIGFSIGLRALLAKGGTKVCDRAWACGYEPDSSMTMAPSSFAASVKLFFPRLYRMRDQLTAACLRVGSFFFGAIGTARKVEPIGDKYLVDSTISLVDSIGEATRRVEGGDSRVYILYIVAALVFFLVLVALM